ncbi:MAG: oligosaccharide flippase family protein [Candidatus Berkelbacteria bacterium]|nr:oligosaccharide flippase family protein [Candidatus Berkelbacteria bacterium]
MSETKKLVKSSFIIFAGTIVGSVFSYLFNMLMGRYLGPKSYGEMTALMSLLMIISVAGGAILTVVMRYSSELYSGGKYRALKKLFAIFTRYVYFLSLALILILLVLVKPIANYFSIDSLLPVFIAFSSLIFGLVMMVNKGVLQGAQRFTAVSFLGVLEMALRLALGIFLVKIGFAVSGALLAIVVATAVSYLVTFVSIKPIFQNLSGDKISKNHLFDKKEIVKYFGPAFLSSVLLIIALNLDVILVKHYFSPTDAGMYAAISAIGKIVLYITAPIITVMFPMISEKTVSGERHYKLLFFSMLFVIIGALLVLIAYVIAPAKIIGILYGQQYVPLYYLLPEIGLAVLLYSLINLLTSYYLVVKDFHFLWFFLVAVIGLVTAISLYHPSLLIVVRLMILDFGLLFAAIIGYYLFSKKDQIKLFLRGE